MVQANLPLTLILTQEISSIGILPKLRFFLGVEANFVFHFPFTVHTSIMVTLITPDSWSGRNDDFLFWTVLEQWQFPADWLNDLLISYADIMNFLQKMLIVSD